MLSWANARAKIEIHLDRLVRALSLAIAIHIVLQLPALPEDLIPAISRRDLHEWAVAVPIVPLHDELAILSDASGVILPNAAPLFIANVL